jgi:hypothetical protein
VVDGGVRSGERQEGSGEVAEAREHTSKRTEGEADERMSKDDESHCRITGSVRCV